MELRSQLHRWERREPDWPAAAVAGFAGGAVLMVLELLWAAAMNDAGPWLTSHLVAAIVLGPGVLQGASATFDPGIVAVALLTHYVLGIVFAFALGFVASGFRFESNLAAMTGFGALFGALMYLIDFHGMVRVFPWFGQLQGWPTLVAHVVFGVTAALLYWQLAGRRASPRRSA